jgi:predicted nucleic acid-binding protein
LGPHRRVALDTSVFIYELDANPRYVDLARAVFEWILQPGHGAVASTITMTEVLVGPCKAGDETRADAVFGLLSQYTHLEWIAPSLEIAHAAARFRGRYGLHTVDALHVATAIHSNATCLIGNDASFRRVTEIENILLDDYL